MGPSSWQILIVVALFVLLFGRGKISDLMGDVAKGIKSFKAGLADDGEAQVEAGTLAHSTSEPPTRVKSTSSKKTAAN